MYKITLEFGGKVVKTYDFDKAAITAGRELDNDIVIDNLGVSRHHCKIEEKASGIHVATDLGSNNGTYVKGNRITTHNLNDGDVIAIGKYSLIYHNQKQAEAVPKEGPDIMDMPTMEIGADDMKAPGQGEPGAPGAPEGGGGVGPMTLQVDAAEMERMQRERALGINAYLEFNIGKSVQKVPLQKSFLFIGSGSDAEFKVSGWRIQRRHALLVRDETGYTLVNIAAKKPPTVNGKIADKERLKNADVIKVGKTEFTYYVGKPS